MKRRVFISLIIIMLLSSIIVYADETMSIEENKKDVNFEYNIDEQKVLDNSPELGCKAAYVADPNSGKVFYEKNAHEALYPASTTKILTALVVLENCNPEEKAIVSKKALNLVPAGYSNAKLQAGEEVTVSDLLYALLIPSANEAANVLAEHVSGSVEEFVELCNNRADELGCEQLHFVNTNGIHNENHCCSAYDLFLIAKECKKYDLFNEIVKTQEFTLPATNVYPRSDRTFKNTNELLLPGTYYCSYCTGIKTGHTTPAGECLVASSSYNDIELISVVLGGGTDSKGLNERFTNTKELFEFVYDNYGVQTIVEKDDVFSTINIENATKETASLDIAVKENINSIAPNDINKDNVEKVIELQDNIVAPIAKDQVLGKITFKVDGLDYTLDLYATHDVEKLPYWLYNTLVVVGIAILFLLFLIIIGRCLRKKK